MLRTEEWTQEMSGMLSTCVVEVQNGETVRVGNDLAEEFSLPEAEAVARYVDQEYRVYPYQVVRQRLEDAGWSRG